MGLNLELAGKIYPAATYDVTAEAINLYAQATNEDNPVFNGNDPIAPPAFPIVPASGNLAAVLFDAELGANIARLVHGEEDHIFHRPIRSGDILRVDTSLESVEAKDSGETFTILSKLVNQHEEMTTEIRSLMFIRGAGSRGRSESGPPKEILFETIQKIDDDQTYRYAEASGDHNPIHVDPEFAKNAAGLPGIICHGMCTMAFVSKAVLDAIADGDPARLARIKVRFSKPVFPGQTITTQGWLEEDPHKAYGFVAFNPDGAAVIREGLAEVLG